MPLGQVVGPGEAGGVVLVVDAREDPGAGAAQGGRVDARALQRFPGDLEQQPLVRVHRGGLARRDTEERRVEVGEAVEEPAALGVGGARPIGVGVVQIGGPAAIGGQWADGVAAVGQQRPQLGGAGDATGEAAGHADDRERLVHRLADDDLGTRGAAEQFGVEVLGERGDGGMVEHDRGRHPQPGGGAEAVAQVHGGQRVESEIAESGARVDPVGTAVAERRGGVLAHDRDQSAQPVGGRDTGQLGAQPGGRRGVVGVSERGDLGDAREQWARTQRGEDGDEPFPGDVGDGGHGLGSGDDLAERGECAVGVEEGQALAVHALGVDTLVDVCVVPLVGRGPHAPGDGGARGAAGTARGGEGVEVGVRGGVGGVVAAAPDPGDGGEQHEVLDVVTEDLVEHQRATDLGTDHGGDLVERGDRDRTELDERGGVQHGPHGRAVGAEPVGQCADVVGAGHVTAGELDHAVQLRGQLGRAGCVRTEPAGKDDLRRSRRHEPAGEVRAERPGAPGEQHRSGGPPRRGGRRGVPEQAGGERPGGTDGDLVLGSGQDGQEVVRRVVGEVDQAAPHTGMLQRRDLAEAPDLGLGGAAHGVVVAGGHRTGGGGPEAGARARVVQCLDGGEGQGEARRKVGVRDVRMPGEGEEGQHALAAQPVGECVAVIVVGDGDDLRAECLGGSARPGAPGMVLVDEDLPVADRAACRRDPFPVEAVAPGVEGLAVPAALVPGGERGQGGAQRVALGPLGSQDVHVAASDGGPELGVPRERLRTRFEPVALALEGVGGQIDPATAGHDRGPVRVDTADDSLAEGKQ